MLGKGKKEFLCLLRPLYDETNLRSIRRDYLGLRISGRAEPFKENRTIHTRDNSVCRFDLFRTEPLCPADGTIDNRWVRRRRALSIPIVGKVAQRK